MTARQEPKGDVNGSLAKTTLHGVLWMTAGRFMKAPTNLIAVAILARLLTPADFGVVAIGILVVGLANVLVDGTFGMVLVQRPKIDPEMIGASVLLCSALGASFAAVLLLAAPLIQHYFGFPQLSSVLRVLAAVLPISAAMAVSTGLLQRASRFGTLTINSFLAQLAYAIIAVALAFGGLGLWALVWAQVVQSVVETLLNYRAVRPHYRIAFSAEALGETFRAGGMFTVSKLFNWAAGNIDKVVIGRLLGASSLGLYSRGASLMLTVNQVIGTGTARVLFSTFARMQHDIARMRRAFDRTLSTSVVGATLASAFIIIFADVIVRLMLGPKWLATVPILRALFAAFITRSGYIVAEAVPLAMGLGKVSAFRQGAQLFLVVAGAWIGSAWGVVGAAIGIAVAYWIFYFLCLVLVQQLLAVGTWRLVQVHLKGLAVAAPAVILTLALRLEFNPHNRTVVELGLAMIFAVVSVLVLALGPASLLSEDIVRARGQLFQFSVSRFRLVANRR